jgi:hypothetical protein
MLRLDITLYNPSNFDFVARLYLSYTLKPEFRAKNDLQTRDPLNDDRHGPDKHLQRGNVKMVPWNRKDPVLVKAPKANAIYYSFANIIRIYKADYKLIQKSSKQHVPNRIFLDTRLSLQSYDRPPSVQN